MAKITIIEGNSNDKDQVRAYMASGLPGISPTIETSKTGDTATITITDVNGEHEVELEDGFSPTITPSKTDGVTTITIVDDEGTKTATINDGVDLTGGVPTNGVIGFDGEVANIPNGYEISSTNIATLTNQYSTSSTEGYVASYINSAIGDVQDNLESDMSYSTNEVKTNGTWIDGKPIYRKVLSTGTMTANTDKNITMDIPTATISQIVRLEAYYNIGIGTLPQGFNLSGYEANAFYSVSNTTAEIIVKCNTSVNSGYVIVEYTKTTD